MGFNLVFKGLNHMVMNINNFLVTSDLPSYLLLSFYKKKLFPHSPV